MRIASQERGNRNVFIFVPSARKSFELALETMAMSIGFDMVEGRERSWETWRQMPIAQRVKTFIDWLGNECNQRSIIVIDDADGFSGDTLRGVLDTLGAANQVILTTRNSSAKIEGRKSSTILLDEMPPGDVVSIIKDALGERQANVNSDDLIRVADVVGGHPLAAKRAAQSILDLDSLEPSDSPTTLFLEPLGSGNPEDWVGFLTADPEPVTDQENQGQLSIWDVFEKSFKRLEETKNVELATRLVEVLPFISIPHLTTLAEYNRSCANSARRGRGNRNPHILNLNVNELAQIRPVLMSASLITSRVGQPVCLDDYTRRISLLRLPRDKRAQTGTGVLRFFYFAEVIDHADRATVVEPHVRHCLDTMKQCKIEIDTSDASFAQWHHEYTLEPPGESQASDPFADPDDMDEGEANPYPQQLRQLAEDFVQAVVEARDYMSAVDGVSSQGLPPSVTNCVTTFRALSGHIKENADLGDLSLMKEDNSLTGAVRTFAEFAAKWNQYPDFIQDINVLRGYFD
jgi:hypothetical protein